MNRYLGNVKIKCFLMLYDMFYKKNHIWVLFLFIILAFCLFYYFLGNTFSIREGAFPTIGALTKIRVPNIRAPPKPKTTRENVANGLAAGLVGLTTIATLGQFKELNDATNDLAKRAGATERQKNPRSSKKPRRNPVRGGLVTFPHTPCG
jgi:hypothetical protein